MQRRTRWRGCTDEKLGWGCVRSWKEIRMVHRSMRNDLRGVDKLYIKRVWLALEDFLFFSLYSFSCIAMQVMTLKQLQLLSCPDSLETNFEPLSCFLISHFVTHITYARTRPLHSYSSLLIIKNTNEIPLKQFHHHIFDSLQKWQRERIYLCSLVYLSNDLFDYLYELRLCWVTV